MAGRRMGLFVVAVVAALAAGTAPSSAQDGDGDLVTFTVGTTQDLDSANVTAGVLVTSYELWTLHFATLTDKAADDFAVIPGLAESWEVSEDGQTVTYTLREGLEWSDGSPLTAEDIAYTINRSRDEEWLNHSATTVNLTATVIDDRTVELVSSVPDPKLPVMDVYIVPKHIYEPISAEELPAYDALDGVGSGPYVLEEWKPGESITLTANPSYWGWEDGEPVIDRVVMRIFSNGDAMAAALEQGEIDAADRLPVTAKATLEGSEDIVVVEGGQGGFSELGMNAGAGGIGDGHPALLDLTVRQAVARSIDRDTLFERVALEIGQPGTTISPSADPSWKPEVPEDVALDFDPEVARTLLDDAGYVDADGDGIREMPDGGRPLLFRYAQRSESTFEPQLSELITGWLAEIGIGTEIEVYDDTQLTDVIGAGNYDLFSWGWTPFVDPDPMLSYFTCDQVTYDVESIGYNDANWCNERYDELYQQQKVELDPERRREIVAEMLLLFYEEAPYVVIYEDAELQAYRTDRFEGWLRQPAETGPVLFTNTSPTYTNLTLRGGAGDGGGLSTGVLIGAGVAALAVVGGLAYGATRRRASAGERD